MPLISLFNAPHGRFAYESLLNVNGNLGWFIMEIPSPIFVLLGALSKPLSTAVTKGKTGFLPPLSALFSPSLGKFLALPSANQVLVLLFVVHYTHRAVLQPLRSPRRSPIHISVPLSAIFFNLINGFVMGSWLGGRTPWSALPQPAVASAALATVGSKVGSAASSVAASELARKLVSTGAADTFGIGAPGLISSAVWKSPLWYLGLASWAVGFAGNVYHDELLMDLRRPNNKRTTTEKSDDSLKVGKGSTERKYSSPMVDCSSTSRSPTTSANGSNGSDSHSPLFTRCQSSRILRSRMPLQRRSLAHRSCSLLLVCLMGPRALNGHAWYKKTFGDKFPRSRKAIIPFIW